MTGPLGAAVRTGTGLDEDAALALWQTAEARAGRRSGGTRTQRTRARLRSPAALLLVAERDGEVVGVLLAELARDEDGRGLPGVLEVALLSVAPGAQRSGVGRALLDALVARYPRLQVWAAADAVAFFERTGLQPSGRVREADPEPLVHLTTSA